MYGRFEISALFFSVIYLVLFSHNVNAQNIAGTNSYQYPIQLSPHLGIDSNTTSTERPPSLSAGKITGQFVGGVVFGGLGGIICGIAAGAIFQCSGRWCELGELALGFSAGYTVTSSLAVYLIGNNGLRTASFPAILVADIAGFAIGAVIGNKMDHIGAIITLFGLPVTGAIIAYNVTRKYDDIVIPPNIEINKNLSLEMPKPNIMKVSPFSKRQFIPGLSLINLQF